MSYLIVKYRVVQILFYFGDLGLFVSILVLRFNHVGQVCCGDLVEDTADVIYMIDQKNCLRAIIIYMALCLIIFGAWLIKTLWDDAHQQVE